MARGVSVVRRGLMVLAVVAATVAFAACGSSGSSKASSSNKGSSGPTTPSTAAPSPAASSPSVVLTSTKLGQVLAAPDGKILYLFTKDQGTTTACTGGCAKAWPPLDSSGKPTVAAGLDASKAATVSSGQVTYNGHLLYYYAGDSAPGDTNGLSIPGWHVVSPLGTAMSGR